MQPELIGGRYRVQEAAGQGGMGTVWRCLDERLHRVVAVKQVGLLPNESVTDSARAFREARSSAGLNHRNVVTVFDVIEQDDHIWLVMEHVPGRSLSQIIREDGPLGPRDVADIGAQVAEGLAAAHEAGTSHRDVKPGNVLVREDGVAKISDFGIARTHGDPALTQSGFLTGTPTYFSPQLARGGDPGPMDDVWALGATLYAAVEGRPLFEQQPNPMAVLHDIASGRARPPERAGFLAPTLRGMLALDPDERWSMAYAGQQLAELAARGDGDSTMFPTRELASQSPSAIPPADVPVSPAATPSEPVTDEAPSRTEPPAAPPVAAAESRSGEQQLRPEPRRRRRWPALVGLGVVLLLAALAWSLTRPDAGSSGAAAQPSSSPSPTKRPSPSSSSTTPSASSSPTSPSSTPSSSSSTSSSPTPTGTAGSAAAQEAFVRDYYAAAPGGTDRAWAMLGPGEKGQGRGAYDGFWRTIRSVEVRSAVARPGSSSVDVTLVYRTTSGGTSTERKREGLVPDGNGGYLLQSDVPAG
ncbi:MAG: hypothetical protein JWR42_67 [Marmoricola sp.]|nr:hypothetical protein [Marmoricola sp.]